MDLNPRTLLSSLRVWVVGFVVWLVVDLGAGWSDEGAAHATARGVGALFAFLLLVRMVRIAWPMHATGTAADRLVAGGRSLRLHEFTGSTRDVSTTTETTSNTHGAIWNVGSTISGSIQTDTTVRRLQQFFLHRDDGVAQGFQLRHDQIALGTNHRVSAAWVVLPLRRRAGYVLFHDHTTRATLYPRTELAVLAMGGSPGLAALWAFLALGSFAVAGSGSGLAVGLLGLAFLIVGTRLQAGYFRRVGSRALVRRLAQQQPVPVPSPVAAPGTPTPAATGATGGPGVAGSDVVGGLSELSRMLASGELTREEFDRLKGRLLEP